MVSYVQKVRTAIHQAIDLGLIKGGRHLASKIYRMAEAVIYEKQILTDVSVDDPALKLTEIMPDARDQFMDGIVECGGRSDIGNFDLGAVCYTARLNGDAVGCGWAFPQSPMLSALGYSSEDLYLGGFFVLPDQRGKGLYGRIVNGICALTQDRRGSSFMAVLETAPGNAASQHGLEKAGFLRKGTVQLCILMGHIFHSKWLEL